MYLPVLYTNYNLLILIYLLCFNPTCKEIETQQNKKCDFKVNFELKSDSIWQAPQQGQQTKLYLLLEMTNLGIHPIRFPIMDRFKVSIQDIDGNEVKMEGGQDVLIPGKPISDPVPPNQKYLLELSLQLRWVADDQLQLSLEDGYGSIWWFGPLKTGSHRISMSYKNQIIDEPNNYDLWFGNANINPITIQIHY